jgi:ADP-heptose:LPS heptosyltransferase
MPDRFSDILVVDLLGGIGDLVIVLPVIHALAAAHPAATLRVVTHEPGADLLRGDPAVAGVRVPAHSRDGAARAAVAAALAERRPDLAVTTTRYGGIPDLLRDSGARCVTDLWRGPPPDELVGDRYLRILRDEGLLPPSTVDPLPRLRLHPRERAEGARLLATLLGPTRRRPVLLVPEAGMAVKLWPERRWKELAAILAGLGIPTATVPSARQRDRLLGPAHAITHGSGSAAAGAAGDAGASAVLPRVGLRLLAAVFAEVARRGGVVVGGDTGPLRIAAAAGARTVALFGPTLASRYGFGGPDAAHLQGLPGCPHRRPAAITTQVCWWHADCPLTRTPPAGALLPAAAPTGSVGQTRRAGNAAPTTDIGGGNPARPAGNAAPTGSAALSGGVAPTGATGRSAAPGGTTEPACMVDISAEAVAEAVVRSLAAPGRPA